MTVSRVEPIMLAISWWVKGAAMRTPRGSGMPQRVAALRRKSASRPSTSRNSIDARRSSVSVWRSRSEVTIAEQKAASLTSTWRSSGTGTSRASTSSVATAVSRCAVAPPRDASPTMSPAPR